MRPGASEEGHVVPVPPNATGGDGAPGGLYCVFRTAEGTVGARSSRAGGETWAPAPAATAQYAGAGGAAGGWGRRALKQPRGPLTPRAVPELGGDAQVRPAWQFPLCLTVYYQ
jgi:hypothetical protein